MECVIGVAGANTGFTFGIPTPYGGAGFGLYLARLKPPFGRLFGGDMLVVTRHMVDFDFVDQPAAFKSTLNLIAFDAAAPQGARAARRGTLQALATYLKTPLAQYLFALVGKTWLLDSRRLEMGDLMQLPFPFEDASDLLRNAKADATALLVERLGIAGVGFEAAVAQYGRHRVGYKDSQVPADAQQAPGEDMVNAYEIALKAGLKAMVGPGAKLGPRREAGGGDFGSLRIALGGGGQGGGTCGTMVPPAGGRGSFNPDCEIDHDPRSSTISLTKPLTVAAWTLDKAHADRMAIVERIAQS